MTAHEPTGFLYPFIDAEAEDAAALLEDLARSGRTKIAESETLQRETLATCDAAIARAAEEMALRFAPAAACLRSGTAAAPPTPKRQPIASYTRRTVGHCRRVHWSPIRPC